MCVRLTLTLVLALTLTLALTLSLALTLTLALALALALTLTGAVPVVIGVVGLFVVISAISLLRFLLSTRIYQFKRIGAAARLITRAVVRLGPSKVKLAVTFCECSPFEPQLGRIDG